MKKSVLFLISGILLVSLSCKKIDSPEEQLDESSLKSAKMGINYTAHLSGDEEVPARETLATGEAIFHLNKEGTELSYKLIVANLEDLHMSHIHLGPVGSNGGVVVWLYPSAPPAIMIPGTTNGVLATGVITSANLVGTLKGKPLADLIAKMNAGGAYVNVHTMMYPAGEIRGQIKVGNAPD